MFGLISLLPALWCTVVVLSHANMTRLSSSSYSSLPCFWFCLFTLGRSVLLFLTRQIPLQNAHFTELKVVYCHPQRFQLTLVNLSLFLLYPAIDPFPWPISCSADFKLQHQMQCYRQCLTSAYNYLRSNVVLVFLCPFISFKGHI